jgi:type IV secretion system protein VirB11
LSLSSHTTLFNQLIGAGKQRSGTSRPRAFAVFGLITSSNAVANWTGRSPGFSPLRIRTTSAAATGSGKTTFAKGLIQLIPEDERLLTIEDARELVVPHRNAVHLLYAKDGQGLAHIGTKQLLETALRMRPDRILLQELLDGTAFFYLRNVNSEASHRNSG